MVLSVFGGGEVLLLGGWPVAGGGDTPVLGG